MYARPVALGVALLGAGVALMASAGYLIIYGALVASERPLQRWYRNRNH